MQSILVCDDDKQIVEAIDIYLTGEGFTVIKAYDGYEALDLLLCPDRRQAVLSGRFQNVFAGHRWNEGRTDKRASGDKGRTMELN